MVNSENTQVKNEIEKSLSAQLNHNLVNKIDLQVTELGELIISTNFGNPCLDVEIFVQQGEFTATYSNGNIGEHWYKTSVPWQLIADDITKLILSLINNGTTQIDKLIKSKVYSTITRIKDVENTEHVIKLSLWPFKDKRIKIFPPVTISKPRSKRK